MKYDYIIKAEPKSNKKFNKKFHNQAYPTYYYMIFEKQGCYWYYTQRVGCSVNTDCAYILHTGYNYNDYTFDIITEEEYFLEVL